MLRLKNLANQTNVLFLRNLNPNSFKTILKTLTFSSLTIFYLKKNFILKAEEKLKKIQIENFDLNFEIPKDWKMEITKNEPNNQEFIIRIENKKNKKRPHQIYVQCSIQPPDFSFEDHLQQGNINQKFN